MWLYFILLLPFITSEFCAWNYRFDSIDNHFNIVYPDKNAVYFGMIIPPKTNKLVIYNDVDHPIATYFSIQIYNDDISLYHFNDLEILNGNMAIWTPYSLNITLDINKHY